METTIAIPNKNKIDNIFDFLDVSETTRQDYKYRIGVFIDYAKQHGMGNNSFLEYKRGLAEKNELSVSTKNKYLGSARIFLKELHRQGLLPTDITHNVKSFKQDKKHKKDGLNNKEMQRLSSSIHESPATPDNMRLKAILSLLALQGLRQCEIVRLDFSDIDFVAKTAFIRGKGKDDKELIDLHPETVQVLKEYVKICNVADGALFTSRSNNSKGKRLTTRALRGAVKDFLKELGIEKVVHGFRHYFTTTLVKNYKGDLLQVAKYTRHSSLEMLQVYNDSVKNKADLPRYYEAFNGVNF
jgi:integrase/recombinase XerC